MNAGIRIICREGTGFPLVKMWLPDDWTEKVTVNPNVITGSGEPDFITVTAVSRNRSSKITGCQRCRVCLLGARSESISQALNDPFMASAAMNALETFPNARYDSGLEEWLYTIAWSRDWHIDQRIVMDTPEDRFTELRTKVLRPLISQGVYYTDELRKKTAEKQKILNEEYRRRCMAASCMR